jgi:hypothetical protein
MQYCRYICVCVSDSDENTVRTSNIRNTHVPVGSSCFISLCVHVSCVFVDVRYSYPYSTLSASVHLMLVSAIPFFSILNPLRI